jgi:hypothetical protein
VTIKELNEAPIEQLSVSERMEKEQKIYDIVLHEIIRQVFVECQDRGVLLEKVTKRYRNLFDNIPTTINHMQQETENLTRANNSLIAFLEGLMEEKSNHGNDANTLSNL